MRTEERLKRIALYAEELMDGAMHNGASDARITTYRTAESIRALAHFKDGLLDQNEQQLRPALWTPGLEEQLAEQRRVVWQLKSVLWECLAQHQMHFEWRKCNPAGWQAQLERISDALALGGEADAHEKGTEQ